jgi:hypothetical protein
MTGKRRGRPKGATSAPPSVTVSARVTVEQREALQELQDCGYTVADVIDRGTDAIKEHHKAMRPLLGWGVRKA